MAILSVKTTIFFMFTIAAASLSSCNTLLCNNTIKQEVISPDSRWKAVVFERDCGATTGGSIQISILDRKTQLSSGVGNIFIVKYYPKVDVTWEDKNHLLIQYPEYSRAAKEEHTFEDIAVVYRREK